jgi:hypothetical protein
VNKKIKEWLKRYLPANIFTTLFTLLVAFLVFRWTNDRVITAFTSSLLGTLSYYGFILIRDMIETRKDLARHKRKYTSLYFLKNVRNLVLEFSVAEILDTFVIAPFFYYIFPILFHDFTLGILVAKYAADIIFYIPTIISYELRKKYIKD